METETFGNFMVSHWRDVHFFLDVCLDVLVVLLGNNQTSVASCDMSRTISKLGCKPTYNCYNPSAVDEGQGPLFRRSLDIGAFKFPGRQRGTDPQVFFVGRVQGHRALLPSVNPSGSPLIHSYC